jgi:hypothetical protein
VAAAATFVVAVATFVDFPTRSCAQRGVGGGSDFVTLRHMRLSARTAIRDATPETAMTKAVQASFFM